MGAGPREDIDALAAEGEKVSAFLRGLNDAGWRTPTRCPPWDVREVVIHMTTMMRKMGEAAAAPVEAEPSEDRASWWDYDIEEDKVRSLTFMEEQTTRFPAGGLYEEWNAAIERCVASVRSALAEGDPVVRPGDSSIVLSEYVATRVLEITIHEMDVRNALGLDPDPSPEGLAVTVDILQRRLGEDPIALGFEAVDFVLLATGRRELDDHDRARLGMPATRLPLLA